MAEHHGRREGDRVWVPLGLTQEDLGKMVGLARETVARLLAELEDSGLIRREGRGVWLLPGTEKSRLV
jgi:CRP-like cAMP-binding protein